MEPLSVVEIAHSQHGVSLRGLSPTVILAEGQAVDTAYTVQCSIQRPEDGCLIAQATISNTGSAPMRIRGIRWSYDPSVTSAPGLSFPKKLRPRYLCTENLRSDWFGIGSTEGDRYA